MSAQDSSETIRIYQEIEALTSEYRYYMSRAIEAVGCNSTTTEEFKRDRIRCRQLVEEIKHRKALLDRLASN